MVCIFGEANQKQSQEREAIYRECVAHESEYTIYLDGAKQDSETFKIETLNKANYTFKLDMENKTIIINRRVYSRFRHSDYDIFD